MALSEYAIEKRKVIASVHNSLSLSLLFVIIYNQVWLFLRNLCVAILFFHNRWENPLMGWTSTGDPYAYVGEAALCFDSEAAARAFAEKHGWEYTVCTQNLILLFC